MLSKGMRWAREIQAIAQTGLSYAPDHFDVERYERLSEIAAEMMAAGDEFLIAPLQSLFAAEVGHATPKIDVRATVFRDDTILLVREVEDGLWTLPGGWVDPGESPSEAAARETLEESGYHVTARRLLALYDRDRHAHPPMAFHVYKLYFDCEIVAGDAKPSSETNDVAFFRLDMLPPLSIDRVLPTQIVRLYALHLDPALPTEFD